MTRHEQLLAEELIPLLGDAAPRALAEKLLRAGVINLKACEQRAICSHLARLEKEGIPRCEAMHAAAEQFCCSYEKVRSAFYEQQKS